MVFSSPKVTLKVPSAYSLVNPMAVKTCDGILLPEEQALPAYAHIPFSSNFINNSLPFTPLNDILLFPGNR